MFRTFNENHDFSENAQKYRKACAMLHAPDPHIRYVHLVMSRKSEFDICILKIARLKNIDAYFLLLVSLLRSRFFFQILYHGTEYVENLGELQTKNFL